MLDVSTVLAFLVIFLVAFFVGRKFVYNWPPGPWALPVIGHLPYFLLQRNKYGGDVPKMLMEMRKTYGPVFSLKIGSMNMVVLTGKDAIEEALIKQSDVFTTRPSHTQLLLTRLTNAHHGVVMSTGDHWKEVRRFILSSLRDFGVGKKSIEGKITDELEVLVDEIARKGGSFDPESLLLNATSNIICSVVFGERFDYQTEDFDKLMSSIRKQFSHNFFFCNENVFPWLSYFGPVTNSPALQTTTHADKEIRKFIRKQVDDHRVKFDGNNVSDFVDLSLKSASEKPDALIASENYLIRVIEDLFLAGTETSSTTLRWAIYLMTIHPQVQTKVKDEIKQVIGDRPPSMADSANMPYTEATLLEIQRIGSIAPTSVVHGTTRDTKLYGYDILKDTMIVPLLYSCHTDPIAFPEPDQFKPGRWLNDRNEIVTNPAFMPFSIGKRACLGELLAKAELFLFFAGLLQKFTFAKANGGEFDGKSLTGFIRAPPQYFVQANDA